MSNARDYLFKIPFRQYSLDNWQAKKEAIMKALPLDKYTDFYDNGGIPEYMPVISDCIDTEMRDFSQTYPCPVMITALWFELSKPGDYHGPHNHGATGYSAILYVDYDAGEHEATKFHCPFLEAATGENLKYQPVVREGDLIVFPSNILHEAPINTGKKNRLIVSFNIMGEDVARSYQAGLKSSPLTRRDFDLYNSGFGNSDK